MNHSKIYASFGDNTSLVIEVCSNPRAHKIVWIVPNSRSIKLSGAPNRKKEQQHPDTKLGNLVAKRMVESAIRVTCIQAELFISDTSRQDEGEYMLVAKNRYGFDGASVVVKVAGGGRKRQKKTESTSISRKMNSEKIRSNNGISSVSTKCSLLFIYVVSISSLFFTRHWLAKNML